jgi:hypothetical protein
VHSTPAQSVTQEIAWNLPGILRKDLAGGSRRTEMADTEETGDREERLTSGLACLPMS